MEMNLIAGLDVGNGYVKGRAGAFGTKPGNIDLPSGVAVVTTSHNIPVSDADVPGVVADIFNEMDASFDTPLVKRANRRLFGRRGVRSGKHLDQFNVSSNHESKAKRDLSAVLTLGCLAGKALQDYYEARKALPDANEIIQVRVRVCLALPINEYIQYRAEFAAGYRNGSHLVTIHNFRTPVRFQIFFDDVQVVAEGAAAQSAIIDGGVPLMQSLLADLTKMDSVMPGIAGRMARITPEMLLSARQTIGVDIGEGTVNFPVMERHALNPDISTSMDRGYGMVLTEALARLKANGYSFNTRKQLTEFLNAGMTPMNEDLYRAVQVIVDEEIDGFATEVEMQFRDVMGAVGAGTDVVYVYGGGATPVRHKLYGLLLAATDDFGGINMAPPILYLDSRYSRYLNRNGLYLMADTLAKRVAEQQAAQAQPAAKA